MATEQSSGHEAGLTVVFVHGFLDDRSVWDLTIAELERQALGLEISCLAVDLVGAGARRAENGPFTYPCLAAEVARFVGELAGPVVVVGQSMGGPVAELAAAASSNVVGLVLVNPAPLSGLHMPAADVATFGALAGDAGAQVALRRQLSVAFPEDWLRQLGESGARVPSRTVVEVVRCWNEGLADAPATSEFAGPVLVLRGSSDPIFTDELIADLVLPRFVDADYREILGSGHWPHLEQPAVFARHLAGFLRDVQTRIPLPGSGVSGGGQDTAAGVDPGGWTQAFVAKTEEAFAAALAVDVVLEAAVLVKPIVGREVVKKVMSAASGVYEKILFTHQAVHARHEFLEWDNIGLGGETMRGVTVLEKGDDGLITRVSIYHRPLGVALKMSAAMAKRTADFLGPGYFRDGSSDDND